MSEPGHPMFSSSRRAFLGTSLAGFAAGGLFAADAPDKADPDAQKYTDDPPFQPNTLFLTWRRDPTTTMTIQWIGTGGETMDPNVQYAPLSAGPPPTAKESEKQRLWTVMKTTAAPYPMSDFK